VWLLDGEAHPSTTEQLDGVLAQVVDEFHRHTIGCILICWRHLERSFETNS